MENRTIFAWHMFYGVMGMLNGKLDAIELSKIELLHNEQISNSGLRTRIKQLNSNYFLNFLMIVEKDPHQERYWLITGYPEYFAYKKWGRRKIVLCYVQPYSDETERKFQILSKLATPVSYSWLDKHNMISELLEKFELKEVAKRSGLTSSQLKYYMIDCRIPEGIVNKAYELEKGFQILNSVAKLSLPNIIKNKLYKIALPYTRNSERLTYEKLKVLNWLLIYTDGFSELSTRRQWSLIEEVLQFKSFLISYWQKKINDEFH